MTEIHKYFTHLNTIQKHIHSPWYCWPVHVFIALSSKPLFRRDVVAILGCKFIELQDSAGGNQNNAQKDYLANE